MKPRGASEQPELGGSRGLAVVDKEAQSISLSSYGVGYNGALHEPGSPWQMLGNGNRVYNLVLGRFHSPDDLAPFAEGGLNCYTYANGDPVNSADPSGSFAMPLAFATGLAAIGAGVAAATMGASDKGGGASDVLTKVSMGLGIAAAAVLGVVVVRKLVNASARWGNGTAVQPNIPTTELTELPWGSARQFKVGDTQVVQVHGAPGVFYRGDKRVASGSFVKELKSARLDKSSPVDLQSCFGANGGIASNAQQVANGLKVPVKGYFGFMQNPGFDRTYKVGYERIFLPQKGLSRAASAGLNRLMHHQSRWWLARFLRAH